MLLLKMGVTFFHSISEGRAFSSRSLRGAPTWLQSLTQKMIYHSCKDRIYHIKKGVINEISTVVENAYE